MTADGFTEKTRELDDQRSGEIPRWRERWAYLQNEHLKDHGHESRVDHRTLEHEGLDREPGHHQGPTLTALERRRERSEVVERWREEERVEGQRRLERAAELGRIEREAVQLQKSIVALSGDLAGAKRQRDAQLARRSPVRVRGNALELWKQHRADEERANQFLDTAFGTTAATLQEWQVANTLERLRELAALAPLAIVPDLEAPCFSYTDVLAMLGSMRVDAPIVLLAGADIDKREHAKQAARSFTLDVAGTLRRPLSMTALLRLLASRTAHSTAISP